LPDIRLPVLSFEGPSALLLDGAAGAAFSDIAQARIWQVARDLKSVEGVLETVPGMNNLMVVFDPLVADGETVSKIVYEAWQAADGAAISGKTWDVPVTYGGAHGPDLAELASAKSMSEAELVARHSAPLYSVAAVGAMPGFVYLSGLDPALATPRLSTPRQGVPAGAVIVGGAQAGIMPVTAPSGWHILGHTDLPLFDPHRDPPAFFRPGDRIRFVPRQSA
jgi:KipI family sensor histidine kinase inhibitor